MQEFTEASLPEAVCWLFESNGYTVRRSVHVFGAEIDLIATQISALRPLNVYCEVTVQYVDTAKYGKDLSKLVLPGAELGAQKIIVSSKGFTPEVRERAGAAGVDTYTYDELFASFEKTDPYVDWILSEDGMGPGPGLALLDRVYEEPRFHDTHGNELATNYLESWLRSPEAASPWLVVVGEYGTGKTALTRVLQRRWTAAFQAGKGVPLPFRVELKHFSRQFDARGLLHYFLDRNELAHIPVQFVETMIASGRVVLLLDGYDEMAQYLNVRERRACLEALSELAMGGARGILTSRPNYFTEAEELRVFEVLYQRLGVGAAMASVDAELLEGERRIDSLFERFLINRHERELQDLDPDQTEALVRRTLVDDSEGAELVVALLRRVFRPGGGEREDRSLSGKPVIVSYLLEVVDELKRRDSAIEVGVDRLSEWQIFDVIISNLMKRDYSRTPQLMPSERRTFLGELAADMARLGETALNEEQFSKLVQKHFSALIARRAREGVADFPDSLAEDLRSSATLTRSSDKRGYLWQFSHNSLREFLLTEKIVSLDGTSDARDRRVPLTDLMQLFARDLPDAIFAAVQHRLVGGWTSRSDADRLDQLLSLTWLSFLRRTNYDVRSAITSIVGDGLDVSDAVLSGVSLFSDGRQPADLSGLVARRCELNEVDFTSATLTSADFSDAALDGCIFKGTDLVGAKFDSTLMSDCDFTGADLRGASFIGIDPDSSILVRGTAGAEMLKGPQMNGYLRYRGARTEEVDPYLVFVNSPKFAILEKILRNLSEGGWSQRRGLEQRGSATKDPTLAKKFVSYLLDENLIESKGGVSAMVRPTVDGRATITRFLDGRLDEVLVAFAKKNLGEWP